MKGTDRKKLTDLADLFGDKYIEKPKSIVFTDWCRRMLFNEQGEVTDIQQVVQTAKGKNRYI